MKKQTSHLHIRTSDQDAELYKQAAESVNEPVSEWVRLTLRRAAQRALAKMSNPPTRSNP